MLLYRKGMQEYKPNATSIIFRLYVIVIIIYAGFQFFISFLMRFPACHQLTNQCDRWPVIRFVNWMRQVFFFLCPYILCTWIYWISIFVVILVCWSSIFVNFLFYLHWRNDTMLDVGCMRELLTSLSKLGSPFFLLFFICIAVAYLINLFLALSLWGGY